jgi:threonine/homoserine/homoserine lactone efflux protein
MGLLVIIALSAGRRAGLATIVGIALGLLCLGGMASLGMAKLLAANPALYDGLRWAGLFYLLYLAFDMYRDSNLIDQQASQVGIDQNRDQLQTYFGRGLISNLLNPKAGLFFLVVLPSFIPNRVKLNSGEDVAALMLVAIYVMIATCIHLCLVGFAAQLQPALMRGKRLKMFQAIMALMLVGIAFWQFMATAR